MSRQPKAKQETGFHYIGLIILAAIITVIFSTDLNSDRKNYTDWGMFFIKCCYSAIPFCIACGIGSDLIRRERNL